MHKTRSSTVALMAAFILCSCATGYQSATNPVAGMFGGYWDKKGPGQLIKVGFDGNGYISKDKVGIYLLYRCAEVAKREGSNYFIMYENLPSAIADRRSAERSVSTTGGKAVSFAYILLTKAPGNGVLSSSDVIKRLGSEVRSTGDQSS